MGKARAPRRATARGLSSDATSQERPQSLYAYTVRAEYLYSHRYLVQRRIPGQFQSIAEISPLMGAIKPKRRSNLGMYLCFYLTMSISFRQDSSFPHFVRSPLPFLPTNRASAWPGCRPR